LVVGHAQELGVVHSGDLHRILETHEDAFAGPLIGLEREDVLPVEEDLALGHAIVGMPGDHLG